MNLDYGSVRALASSTRLKILNIVLDDEESTTTKISDELNKSKSTVSNHLEVLENADLLEKDEEDGRRRVIYRPTEKSEAIVEGKERKVKFSIVSSALTAAGGVFLLSRGLTDLAGKARTQISDRAPSESGSMGTMDAGGAEAAGGDTGGQLAAEAVNQTSQNATEGVHILQKIPETSLIFAGAGALLALSLLFLSYVIVHRKISSGEQ